MPSPEILHLWKPRSDLLATACESYGLPHSDHSFVRLPACSPHNHNHGLSTQASLLSTTTEDPIILSIFFRNLFTSMFCCLLSSRAQKAERQRRQPNRCTGDGICLFRFVQKLLLSNLGVTYYIYTTFWNN